MYCRLLFVLVFVGSVSMKRKMKRKMFLVKTRETSTNKTGKLQNKTNVTGDDYHGSHVTVIHNNQGHPQGQASGYGIAYGQCVVDDSSRLLDHQRDFRGSLTPGRCIRYCYEQGFRFAGVQFSYQCFCGNDPPHPASIAPQTECNKICEGDRNQFCGGDWRNNVFETGFFVNGSVAYGQCVVDDSSRLLDHQRDFRGSLTPDRCIRYCSEQGFRFAGVQFSYQCFCGNNPPPHAKIVSQIECNKICDGDRNQFCGGDWRNNVFGTGVDNGQHRPGWKKRHRRRHRQ